MTMTSMPADELENMRATVAAFLDDAAPMSRVREVMGLGGFDDAVWGRLRDELGLQGAVMPERCGGLGVGFADGVVLLAEFARRLTPVPFAELLVAGALLDAIGGEAADQLLCQIADAATIVAIGGADPAAPLPSASPTGGGWRLTGGSRYVPFGQVADVVLLAASAPGGDAVFAIHRDAPGLIRRELWGLDATRQLADLELHHVAATRISQQAGGARDAARMRHLVLATQAAEAAAGASVALDLTVDYLTVRQQFGRPIGSFQALKHRCADHAVAVAGARSTAHHAALASAPVPAAVAGGDPFEVIAPLAKAVCADVYFAVAADAIQLHGGIGFTFEHDLHLYFKRAKATQQWYGHPDVLRAGLASAAGLS